MKEMIIETRKELENIQSSRLGFIRFLIDKGVLKNSWKCKKCGDSMEMVETNCSDGFRWLCKKNRCGRYNISVRKGSVFNGIKSPLKIIISICYEWCQETTYKQIMRQLKIKNKLLNTVINIIRKKLLNIKTQKIGGKNHVVEIDESAISKRKYNVGRVCKTFWCVGGIDRETKKFFFEIVQSRTSAKLLAIIKNNVEEGTTIITDGWKGYLGIDKNNYKHYSVNHKENFVNPLNKEIHTQNIEILWRWLKKYIKNKSLNSFTNIKNYINEHKFLKGSNNVFEELLAVFKHKFN